MSRASFNESVNLWGVAWVVGALCLALGSAWAIARAVHHVPWRVEQRLSRLMDTTRLGPPCDVAEEPAWQDLVQLVAKLYPQAPFERQAPITLHLIDNSEVNAFASLGGEVFILTGLLDALSGPDALAGVLAHELEHVSRRHLLHHLVDQAALSTVVLTLLGDDAANQSLAQSADYWSGLHFTRSQEAEADQGAIRRMRRAGVAVGALSDFFSRMAEGVQSPTWISDHPGMQSRIAALHAEPSYPSAPAMPWSRWQALKTLCKPQPHPALGEHGV